jgi:DNA topoisomerase-3
MVCVLMVAEKPSICNSIADALSHGKCDTRGGSPPVHEFGGNFHGRPCTFRVTSVVGHVFSIDFPAQYANWDAVDPVDLFQAPTHKTAEKGSIVRHLQTCAKGADYLVLWLDCDREGENICFEVMECVRGRMTRLPHGQQQVFRAKFSAVARADIEKAMTCLGEPNENESLAVDARQELDLKVGVAFSRFQTKYFQGKYGDLDSKLVSYGPCQTPTLGFCVDRHDEIVNFEPEPFWRLDVVVRKSGYSLALDWQRGAGRVFDHELAIAFQVRRLRCLPPPAPPAPPAAAFRLRLRRFPPPAHAPRSPCTRALTSRPHAPCSTSARKTARRWWRAWRRGRRAAAGPLP